MCRLFSSVVTRLILLSLLAVLVCAKPAPATIVTWYLHDVTLEDGGTVTGSFVCDTRDFTVGQFGLTINFGDPSYITQVYGNPNPVNPLPGSEVLSPDTGYMCYHPGKWYFDFWKYSFFGPIGGYAIDLALYLDYGDNPMDRMDPEASYPLWHGWSIRSEIRIREARWRDDPYTSIVDHFEYYDDIMGGYISTEVPLPSTVLLLGSGLLGLAGWRRFRKG